MEKEIESYLNQNYLMIRKGRFYYFLGGALVMIIAILGISIQTVNKAISDSKIKEIREAINDMKKQSQRDSTEISRLLENIKDKRLFSMGTVQPNANGEETINVPSETTTTDDWDIFLTPNKIGNYLKDKGDNINNALLLYDTQITPKEDRTGWRVKVWYNYRYGQFVTKESWGATYILLRKVFRSDK